MDSKRFKRAQTRRTYEEVAKQIQQAIVEEHFKPGDKLPSQKELIEQFQVSSFTIMGALRLLEQSGLVHTKLGTSGGTFVSELNTAGLGKSIELFMSIMKVTLEELVEFRLTIEGQAAYWAAKRRRKRDIKKLEDILSKIGEVLDSDRSIEQMVPLDRSFHLSVAEASRNRLFLAIIEAVNEQFIERTFSLTPQKSGAKIYADLFSIFQAIKEGKADAAQKAAREHIVQFGKLLISEFKEKYPEGESFLEVLETGMSRNRGR